MGKFPKQFWERRSLKTILRVELEVDEKKNIPERRGELMKYSLDRDSLVEELETIKYCYIEHKI